MRRETSLKGTMIVVSRASFYITLVEISKRAGRSEALKKKLGWTRVRFIPDDFHVVIIIIMFCITTIINAATSSVIYPRSLACITRREPDGLRAFYRKLCCLFIDTLQNSLYAARAYILSVSRQRSVIFNKENVLWFPILSSKLRNLDRSNFEMYKRI